MTMKSTGLGRLTKIQCDKLNDLIQLDRDAVEAYDAAIERLEDALIQARLGEFRTDHERHIRDLSGAVAASGGEPADKGDFKRFLTKGKVILGNLTGDAGILRAMLSNERETNEKYEDAVNDSTLAADPSVRRILSRGLADERRHRAWIEGQLDELR